MEVALTGATGHLGGAILRELHSRGHRIHALRRSSVADIFDDIPIRWVKGDLQQPEALAELTASCDALIHSAGLISTYGDQGGLVPLTNVEGTRNLMEAAKTAGIRRVIHISSIQAYRQTPSDEILNEQRPLTSDHAFAYDRSKRDGQQVALSYQSSEMDVLVVNPTSILGPFDFKPSKLGQAIIQMATGRLPYVLQGGTDYCDARDLSHAIVNGLTMGQGGASYLLSGKWHSLHELARLVSKVTSRKYKVTALPPIFAWIGLPFALLAARIKNEEPLLTREAIVAVTKGNRQISSLKARKELNYQTRPFEETIADTCAWFIKNGYLE